MKTHLIQVTCITVFELSEKATYYVTRVLHACSTRSSFVGATFLTWGLRTGQFVLHMGVQGVFESIRQANDLPKPTPTQFQVPPITPLIPLLLAETRQH